jgi:hypothetical protein
LESNGRSYKGDRKTALVIPGSCVAGASQDCEDTSNGLFEILRMAAFCRRTMLAAFTVSGLFELTVEGAIFVDRSRLRPSKTWEISRQKCVNCE